MASEDEQDRTPSLAPPSLSPSRLFGRRRPSADGGDTQVLPETGPEADFTDVGSDPSDDDIAPAEPASTQKARAPRPSLSALRTHPVLTSLRRAASQGRSDLGNGLTDRLGATAVGLVTGIALLGFIWVGLRGCGAVGTTQTCSPGSGLTALVVIFALTVLVGRVLLGLLKVREPVMTSFLAVGLTCLVAVLGPGWLIDSAATVVLVPLLSAGAFALASWVATLEVDLDD